MPEQRAPAPSHATGTVEFVPLDDVAADETFRLRPDGDVSDLASSLGRLGQLAPIELRPLPGAGTDGPRWQVVSGFRRLAAVRLLARDRVLARVHEVLSDADAWGLALADALVREPFTGPELEALRERLRATGVAPWAEELVDDAIVRAPVAAELREEFHRFLAERAGPLERAGAVGVEGNGSRSPEVASPEAPVPFPAPAPVFAPPPPQAAATAEEAAPIAEEAAPIEVTPEELAQDLVARLYALNQDLALAWESWKDLPPEGRRQVVEQARYVAALFPLLEAEG